jgi:hypothetical protein
MKILMAVLAAGFVWAVGCSDALARKAVTPEVVIATFEKAGIPIGDKEVYTAETDVNKLLGRPGQYVAKANWADSRLRQPADDMAGGSVEIFRNERDLKARKAYVENIGRAMPTMAQYQYQKGLVLIRLDKALTPEQAAEYEKAIKAL